MIDFSIFLDGVVADVRGTVSTDPRTEGTFIHVETLALELTIKKVRLSVSKVFQNNRILSKYLKSSCLPYTLST